MWECESAVECKTFCSHFFYFLFGVQKQRPEIDLRKTWLSLVKIWTMVCECLVFCFCLNRGVRLTDLGLDFDSEMFVLRGGRQASWDKHLGISFSLSLLPIYSDGCLNTMRHIISQRKTLGALQLEEPYYIILLPRMAVILVL